MVRGRKLLDAMRANPRNWRIEDVATVCRAFGLRCETPKSGSHYKIKSMPTNRALVIPAHRPIKAPYIRQLVTLIDAYGMNDG